MTKFKRPDYDYTAQKPGYPIDPYDSGYHQDITRQIWSYLRDHRELGLDSGWDMHDLVVMDIDKYGDNHNKYARIDYNHDTDSIDVVLSNGNKKSFPFDDATIEDVLLPIINLADGKAVPADESYYTQGNRDVQKFNPAKMQESFPSRAAYLSYKKGYQDGCDGIYEKGTL